MQEKIPVPWRYKAPWIRAHVHEYGMKLFRIEARKDEPDYEKVSRKVLQKFRSLTAPLLETNGANKAKVDKARKAVGTQLDNFMHAAKTTREVHEEYKDKPAELYLALHGDAPEKVRILRRTFSIPFLLPREEQVEDGVYDPEGVLRRVWIQQFMPAQGLEARRRLEEKGMRAHYIGRLCTYVTKKSAAEHEEHHVVSAIQDAGRKLRRMEYMQVHRTGLASPLHQDTGEKRRIVIPLLEEAMAG
ncbi:hypothetical protein HZC09_01630 [Candidatus Micrarchaeota archaeon]|nr:hypothetical protein [Candidatus Micrarchaeota archaeon]